MSLTDILVKYIINKKFLSSIIRRPITDDLIILYQITRVGFYGYTNDQVKVK